MATIEQRLTALEQANNAAPMLVLFVTDLPTPAQQAEIDKAIMTGGMMIVFVARGDTAWIAGSDTPPWEGCDHDNN